MRSRALRPLARRSRRASPPSPRRANPNPNPIPNPNPNPNPNQDCRRFFQLSNDLTTLRWSWREYLLLDEIVKVCPGPEADTVELHAGDIFQR